MLGSKFGLLRHLSLCTYDNKKEKLASIDLITKQCS